MAGSAIQAGNYRVYLDMPDQGPVVPAYKSTGRARGGTYAAKLLIAQCKKLGVELRLMGPLTMAPGMAISAISNHPYALEINLLGKRCTCKPSQVRMGVFRSGHLLAEQPEGISFVVFDQKTLEDAARDARENPPTGYGGFFGHPKFPEDPMADLMDTIAGKAKMPFGPPQEDDKQAPPKEEMEEGVTGGAAPMQGMNKLFRGETIEELAEKMGVPADALRATIWHYNDCCQAGFDDEFFKPVKYLVPLKGPYFALRCNLGTDGAFGGVLVNSQMQAYARDGGLVRASMWWAILPPAALSTISASNARSSTTSVGPLPAV